MQGHGQNKLTLVLAVVFLFVLEVTSRSFRAEGRIDSQYSSTEHPPSTSVDPAYSHGDSAPQGIPLNQLVNVLGNKFRVEEPWETKSVDEDAALSSEEQEMIKKRILDGLGLTSIPTRNLSSIPKEELDIAYREYTKAVQEEEERYQQALAEEEEEEDEEDEIENKEEERKGDVTSFRFYSIHVSKNWRSRGRRSVNEGQQIVHFFVSLPTSAEGNGSQVTEAKSRFWKKGVYTRDSNSSSSTIPVSFYRLDDIPRGRFRYTKLDPVYITTKNVSIYGNEWLDVDVTDVVKSWLASPKSDTGILIKCPDCETAGVRFFTGGRRKGLQNGSKVPRLNVKTEIIGLRRVKRSRKMRKSLKKRIHRQADCHDATHSRGKRSNRCCRRSMQVRFADLPRFDFIVSPKEFDAFYCSGKCPARYNPANEHALLQSLLNLRGKNNVPGPCCAPTKLKGLNILHIGEDGRIKTTFWRDVIVTECGCA